MTETQPLLTGPQLRHIRHQLGVSMAWVGKQIGLDHMRVYHWEKEYHPIPKKWQIRLVTMFMEIQRKKASAIQPCQYCGGSGMARAPEEEDDC